MWALARTSNQISQKVKQIWIDVKSKTKQRRITLVKSIKKNVNYNMYEKVT